MEATLIGGERKHRRRSFKPILRRLKLAHHPRHPSSDLLIIATFDHYPHPAASSSSTRGHESISTDHSPPLMQLMKYEVPVVLLLLSLKYQGNTKNLFRENPVPVWCFIAATSVYWLILGAMKQITKDRHARFHKLLTNAGFASALLSLISLVAMFLHYPLSLIPLALVISSPMIVAILYAFHLFLIGIEFLVNIIHGLFVRARGGRNLTEEASSPV